MQHLAFARIPCNPQRLVATYMHAHLCGASLQPVSLVRVVAEPQEYLPSEERGIIVRLLYHFALHMLPKVNFTVMST